MLNELSKHHTKWQNIAYSLCKDRMLADDLVSEMYIKMSNYEYNEKKLRVAYVRRIVYTLFIDYIRRENKTISINNLIINETTEEDKEFCDKDLSIINKANKLTPVDRNLLIECFDSSLREVSRNNDIGVNILFRKVKQARKEVLGDNYNAEYNNKRLKYKKAL